ncbi:ML domain-containing protein [Streptomyces sp. NPDC003011]
MTSWSYENAGLETDAMQVGSVDVTPDPPQPGAIWTVNLRTTVREEIKEGAYLEVRVNLGLVKIMTRTYDLFAKLRGEGADDSVTLTLDPPVENGVISPGEAVLTASLALASDVTRAPFTVLVAGYTADDDNLIKLKFKVSFERTPA